MGAYPRRGCGCCAAWAAVPLAALLGAPLWLREVSVLRVGRGLEECSSLGGTNLVITGSTSGIGLEAARHAVSLGAQVVVSGPDQARTKRAAKEVQGDAFRGRAVPIAMDLGDFDDVHRFAAEVSAAMPVVQMLYLNAGIAYANFATEWSMRAVHSKRDADFVSKSGHDRVMATNHLGHFLLTVLLAPVLAPGASIVVMGSHGMWHCGFGRLMPDDRPKWEAREGAQLVQRKNAAIAYLDSKLANRCFVGALRRKSAELGLEGARVVLHDPGMVLSSMARHRGSKEYTQRTHLSQLPDAASDWAAWASARLWGWPAPTAAAGRLLVEAGCVSHPVPDVVYSYWLPKEFLWWYAPRSMLEFRKNHTHVSSSFLFRQWATWGSLHASIGPECGEDFEDRFWAWSVNATDASASIASLAARRPATAAAGCRDDPSFEGPWKGASCEAWAGWVRAQRFRCEDYREQAPLLLRSCPVACGTCEAGEGAEPKVGKGRASAGDVGPEAKAGKGRAPPAAAAATGAEAAASRGPAAQSAGKGRPQAEAPSPPPPTVVYFLKQSGVCEKHVETESECEEAAESLSEVRASRIEFSFSRVDRPVGCYWYKHSDTLNWNTNIAGVDCNKQRQCICKEGQRAEAHVEAESEEAKQERLQALRAQLSGSGGILGEDGGGSARRKGGGSKTIIMGDASSQSHIEYREVDDDGGMTSLNPHGR